MDRKKLLARTLILILLVGIGFVAYPFIASMGVSAKAKNDSLIQIEIPPLKEGIVSRVDVNGVQLFILRPNEEQSRSIKTLDDHVWNKEVTSFRHDLNAYVYWGMSTKWGCPLEPWPAQESRIKRWDENANWAGGFWDGHCEVSYDYAGRAIKTYRFTFNGYRAEHPNMDSPTVLQKQGNGYVVSIWQR